MDSKTRKRIIKEFLDELTEKRKPIQCLHCDFTGALQEYRVFAWGIDGVTTVFCPKCNGVLHVGRVNGIFFKKNMNDII